MPPLPCEGRTCLNGRNSIESPLGDTPDAGQLCGYDDGHAVLAPNSTDGEYPRPASELGTAARRIRTFTGAALARTSAAGMIPHMDASDLVPEAHAADCCRGRSVRRSPLAAEQGARSNR